MAGAQSGANYEPSRFTVRVTDEEENLILYNSYSGALGVLPKVHADAVTQMLRKAQTTQFSDDPVVKSLIHGGFLVPQGTDEFQLARNLRDMTKSGVTRSQLIILPTETCNFRCVYCYESFKRGRMTTPIRDSLKKAVERIVPDIEVLSIHWFGGEPTTALDVIEELSYSFISSTERANVNYSAGITTNGLNLDEETVDILLGCKIHSFQITLDGPQEIHDARRKLLGGGGTFERIVSNLHAMASRSPKDDFKVAIRVNFDAESRGSVPQLLTILSESLVGDPRFAIYFRPVGAWGGPNDNDLPIIESAAGEIAMFEMHEQALTQNSVPVALMHRFLQPNGSVCYASQAFSHVVGADGRLMKCTVAIDDPVNIVGRIEADGTFKIDFQKERLWLDADETTEPACQSCHFRPACQGAHCPLVRIRENRTPCPPEKLHIKHALRLIAKAPLSSISASAAFDAD